MDSRRSRLRPLRVGVAYLIARDLACANRSVELDTDLLTIVIERILTEAQDLVAVRKLVEANIANCNEIIAHLEKGVLSLDFCRTYLKKFLSEGTLSKADLLHFYSGGDCRDRYRAIQQNREGATK